MSVAKAQAEKVFLLNQVFPVFGREYPVNFLEFVTSLPTVGQQLLALQFDRPAQIEDPEEKKTAGYEATSVAVGMHKVCRWASFGMPAFHLSHSAAAAFALTDSGPIRMEDFHPPFPTFVVQLPTPWIEYSGRPISGVIWHEIIEPRGKHSVAIHPTSADGNLYVEGMVVHYSEFETVAAWMESCIGRINASPEFDEFRHLIVTVLKLMTSLCLYVSTKGRGRPLSKSAKQIRQTGGTDWVKTGVEPAIWETGREIKIDRGLIQAAADFSDRDRKGKEGWKLRSRFTVRGHFRNQAHGPGRAERKLLWIEPHWKGPKDGVGITHLYEPQEDA